MNPKEINPINVAMVLAFIVSIAGGWVAFQNRDDNMETFTVDSFALSCSSAVKINTSYLTLVAGSGVTLTSLQAVANCHDLVANSYVEAIVTKRKSQDGVLGSSLISGSETCTSNCNTANFRHTSFARASACLAS